MVSRVQKIPPGGFRFFLSKTQRDRRKPPHQTSLGERSDVQIRISLPKFPRHSFLRRAGKFVRVRVYRYEDSRKHRFHSRQEIEYQNQYCVPQ